MEAVSDISNYIQSISHEEGNLITAWKKHYTNVMVHFQKHMAITVPSISHQND